MVSFLGQKGGNMDNFEYFKERFIYYQNKCGLQRWDITFKESKQRCRARVYFDTDNYATVQFNPNLKRWKNNPDVKKEIEDVVKHEICHLIIGKLYLYALQRFDVNKKTIDDEFEGVCNLLEKLIL
jgi:hypothetical protein